MTYDDDDEAEDLGGCDFSPAGGYPEGCDRDAVTVIDGEALCSRHVFALYGE